jgi:hypothetical protein
MLLEDKRAQAEISLGLTSALPVSPNPPPDHLYQWADDIRNKLIARGDLNPKLTLAESLDIPNERHWLGCVSTQRNTPRHRVVARFAREGLWDQIWSLNWDCIQESALENVGIRRRARDAGMPWPTVFNTFITAADCAQMGEANSVKVLKPHGCVMALVEAQRARDSGNAPRSRELAERFLITATELRSLDPVVAGTAAQQIIFYTLCTKLCSQPFVVAGWRASDQYLIDQIVSVVRQALSDPNRQTPLAADEFSLIDREFNPNGHATLASVYGKDAAATHINVGQPGLNTDEFFLWLQALYAVDCLRLRALDVDHPALDEIAAQINQPPDIHRFVISWADNFLPVWIRLCWRARLVNCENADGAPVEIDDIALESRDEHIPWRSFGSERPEMIAAARILVALHRSGHADEWDFEKFPGAFYRDFELVIPIPVWPSRPPNDLRGLRALIDAINTSGAGYINSIALVFVGPNFDPVISNSDKIVLKQLVASYLGMARFADPANLEEIQLGDL